MAISKKTLVSKTAPTKSPKATTAKTAKVAPTEGVTTAMHANFARRVV